MSTKSQKTFHFEQSLKELEALVETMEHGDQHLEDALKTFERGIGLIHDCQQALKAAEQKVNLLLKKDGKETLVAFKNDDES